MATRSSATLPLLLLSSIGATVAVVSHAFHLKKQFYPSVVYLTNSGISMMFIYYQLAVLAFMVTQIFKRLFFGRLRNVEREHLYDKSWFAVTETCLAMTIFRDEFTAKFAGQFMLLLGIKMFHWLTQDRVDFMEQSPNINRLFHLRMIGVSALLTFADAFMVYNAAVSFMAVGPSMQLLFGFEYIVLLTVIMATFVKYCMQLIDINNPDGWEDKAIYMFYIDLVLDFFKLSVYIAFFVVIMNYYGLPLHIIRDLCATFRSFVTRLHRLMQSRRATRNLDTRYPDPTADELAQTDNICVICREEMYAGDAQTQCVCKKLNCGHIFHTRCLRSWLHRQQICPTCRADVLVTDQAVVNREQVRAAALARPQQQQQQQQPHQPQQQQQQQPVPRFQHTPQTNAASATTDQQQQQQQQQPSSSLPTPSSSGHTQATSQHPHPPQPPPPQAQAFGLPPSPSPYGFPSFPTPPPPHSGTRNNHESRGATFATPPTNVGFPTMAMPGGMPGSPFPPPPMMFGGGGGGGSMGMGSPGFQLPNMFAHQQQQQQNPFAVPQGNTPPPGFVPFNFSPRLQTPIAELTTWELRELEGHEREKVIARIAFLRSFRSECDAMLARFGQYEQIASENPSAFPSESVPTSGSTHRTASSSSTSKRKHAEKTPLRNTSVASSSSVAESTIPASAPTPNSKAKAKVTVTSKSKTETDKNKNNTKVVGDGDGDVDSRKQTTAESMVEGDEVSPTRLRSQKQEEVRQLRLRKLSSQTSNNDNDESGHTSA